jgi:hypothetical protein
METPVNNSKGTSTGTISVFPINGGKQICNPSISLDTVNFKGCMLWLNFAGEMIVDVLPSLNGFNKMADQHDRLTITDTSNTVRWFIMKETLGAQYTEELQDPEWSSHPSYITTLLSSSIRKKWNCYAINPQTNHFLKMSHENMNAESTPHFWVPRSSTHQQSVANPQYDSSGFVDRASLITFFGTDSVKIVYSLRVGGALSLYYMDYTSGSGPKPLLKPAGKENFNVESALISPDGKWVIYNAYQTTKSYDSYIQELRDGAKPVLLKSGAADPHWWHNPRDERLLYVVYTEIPGDNLVLSDLSDPKLLTSADAGITYIQQISLSPGLPGGLNVLSVSSPNTLVKLPLKGGLSPDGHYVCTGYEKAYIVEIK